MGLYIKIFSMDKHSYLEKPIFRNFMRFCHFFIVNSLQLKTSSGWRLWMFPKILQKFLSVYSMGILKDLSPQFRVKDDAAEYSEAKQM